MRDSECFVLWPRQANLQRSSEGLVKCRFGNRSSNHVVFQPLLSTIAFVQRQSVWSVAWLIAAQILSQDIAGFSERYGHLFSLRKLVQIGDSCNSKLAAHVCMCGYSIVLPTGTFVEVSTF